MVALKLTDVRTGLHNDWCPGCVLPGTPIHANPSVHPIEDIQVGSKVLGSDGAFHVVTKVMNHNHSGLMHRLIVEMFGETSLTPEHPVLIAKSKGRSGGSNSSGHEWIEASKVVPGDYVVYPLLEQKKDGAATVQSHGGETKYLFLSVLRNEVFQYSGPVYNLEVADVNSYVTSNAILHNCGDFGIEASVQMAMTELNVELDKIIIFSGIGCHGKIAHWTNTFGIHTLHGRTLAYAQGAKLANPGLEVIAIGGDGDGYGIGAGHFVHAGRRNIDMTYIVHDNQVYGLTKGQASPTQRLGEQTKSLPKPNINSAINPIMLGFAAGYTFIARSYAFDNRHLKDTIKRAVAHKGFALVDVLQPCPTYNDIETKAFYSGEDRIDPVTKRATPRCYDIEKTGYNPVVTQEMTEEEIDRKVGELFRISKEWGDKIPIGVFYQNESVPSYQERISQRISSYIQTPPATQPIRLQNGKSTVDASRLFKELTIDTLSG